MASRKGLGKSKSAPRYNKFKPNKKSRQAKNAKQPINRLPPELLSRIFAIGDQDQRSRRLENAPYSGFQDLAIQVCSHWRNVAINSPALWTYIYISRAPNLDCLHTLIYLARSGTSSPLTIDIEMRTDYLDDLADDTLEEQVDSARKTLEFLVSCGATTARWSSLIFCAKLPNVLFEVVRFLNVKSAPVLQFLSLWWKARVDPARYQVEEREYLSFPDLSEQERSVFRSRMPCLRNLDLNALPVLYQVKRILPLVTGLTHLKLAASLNLYPLPKLHTLLSSNPQLQCLSLSSGFCVQDEFEPTTLRVSLPDLRSLSLTFGLSYQWASAIIRMVDAPTVQRLHLCAFFHSETIASLVKCVTRGGPEDRFIEISQALSNRQPITYEAVYPMVQRLELEGGGVSGHIETVRALFSVFPTVTHVSLPSEALPFLGDAPWVFPNLQCIRADGPSVLNKVLHSRAAAGLPVGRVELVGGSFLGKGAKWPESVKVAVERRVPTPGPDSDDESDDFDYDEDEDYQSDYDDYHSDYDEFDYLYEHGLEFEDFSEPNDSDGFMWDD